MIAKLVRYIWRHRRMPTLNDYRRRHKTVMPLPTQLQIEPTMACNFRCKYCPHGEYSRQTGEAGSHMDLALFRKLSMKCPC